MVDIKGYEGKYAITSCGKVWSYKTKRFLKTIKTRKGYEIVYLYKDKSFIDDIDEQPTADVVEVVRCRECKHNQDNGGDCNRTITHTSRNLVCEVNEYKYIGLEYCSYGERREE